MADRTIKSRDANYYCKYYDFWWQVSDEGYPDHPDPSFMYSNEPFPNHDDKK